MALQGILESYLKEFNQTTGELCILFYSEYSQRGTQHYINFWLALTLWVTINRHQSIWIHMHCFPINIFTVLINPLTSRGKISTNNKQSKKTFSQAFLSENKISDNSFDIGCTTDMLSFLFSLHNTPCSEEQRQQEQVGGQEMAPVDVETKKLIVGEVTHGHRSQRETVRSTPSGTLKTHLEAPPGNLL